MKQKTNGIVVDASVARAAGGTAHPVSSACRGFLNKMRDGDVALVMTDALLAEWKRHRSGFARTWQGSMHARRRVTHLSAVERPDLRAALDHCAQGQADNPAHADNLTDAIRKDALLVEASLAADTAPVASNDDKMRDYLRACASTVKPLRPIAWVNPAKPAETPLDWLDAGAPSEAWRRLGAAQADRDDSP
jgi:hypothetical protein